MELELTRENFVAVVFDYKGSVLIDFWATWCGPCRMQGPILEAFAKEHPEVKVGKVNVDEQGELAEKFRIMSIPTLLVFKDGKLVNNAVGLHDKKGLEALVE